MNATANVIPDAVGIDDAGSSPLMRGGRAIASYLGISTRRFQHLDRARMLPTFRLPHDSASHATVAGLREWRSLPVAAALLD